MKPPVSDIAFTASVKQVQERLGSRRNYARTEQAGGWSDTVSPELAEFVEDDQELLDRLVDRIAELEGQVEALTATR